MGKTQYKEQNTKKYKIIIIILFILVFVLMILSILLDKTKKEQPSDVAYDNIKTIKEVIEYYDSKYISENESEEKDYNLDVYLKFKVLPYNEDNTSNEEYYNNLLEDCAKIISYKNFRMIDKENDLLVEIICSGQKIKTIKINGIEDYFIYTDSQLSLREYREIETTDFAVNSELLKNCIDNNWNPDINFGGRDSIFDEYYIYFDEGIKVRTINNKIYNIVFDKKYNGEVINSNFPGKDLESVKVNLGEPTFEDEENKIIGYKGKDLYVFFTESEISVYRVSSYETDEFFDLADRYINKELDFLDFMNELTYLWPDYSDYNYSKDYVYISYPLKGVEIKLNYENTSGILIYNNIKTNLRRVGEYLENTDFVSRLQLDLVFETEKRRVENDKKQLDLCNEYIETLEEEQKNIIGDSFYYGIYAEKDNNDLIYEMKFISKSEDRPDRELSDSIDTYLWLNNNLFLYSKSGKGIYLFNLDDGTVRRVITGDSEYELKGYGNGILKYDNVEEQFQY